MRVFCFLIPLFLSSLPIHAKERYASAELDELRIELDDLKYGLKSAQVEMGIFAERLQKQEGIVSSVKGQVQTNTSSLVNSSLSALEKKVLMLEKTIEKAVNDLRALSTSASEALNKIHSLENELVSHEKRLDEVAKLKGTLTSISKAISQKSIIETGAASAKVYSVKAGDSLEKISRIHHVPVETIRKLNQLPTDKIVVGQELRLSE